MAGALASAMVNTGPSHFHIIGGARVTSRFKCSIKIRKYRLYSDYILLLLLDYRGIPRLVQLRRLL